MKKKILVVDDIPGYLDILELYMPSESEIVKALSLDEAIAAANEGNFDLAIVDIRLDESNTDNKDGLTFLKWVRQHRSNMPVIMVSAYQEFEYETESIASGARCFLRKPVNPEELANAVEEALAKRRVAPLI